MTANGTLVVTKKYHMERFNVNNNNYSSPISQSAGLPAEQAAETTQKKGWYPGKYLSRLVAPGSLQAQGGSAPVKVSLASSEEKSERVTQNQIAKEQIQGKGAKTTSQQSLDQITNPTSATFKVVAAQPRSTQKVMEQQFANAKPKLEREVAQESQQVINKNARSSSLLSFFSSSRAKSTQQASKTAVQEETPSDPGFARYEKNKKELRGIAATLSPRLAYSISPQQKKTMETQRDLLTQAIADYEKAHPEVVQQ